ncbi:hypothetical protein MIR68_012471 [Amoeboaphelidium protococcarum]|nr:hypothetical protein MIR68_012471 [Amoeboaphelidium protococcarum]
MLKDSKRGRSSKSSLPPVMNNSFGMDASPSHQSDEMDGFINAIKGKMKKKYNSMYEQILHNVEDKCSDLETKVETFLSGNKNQYNQKIFEFNKKYKEHVTRKSEFVSALRDTFSEYQSDLAKLIQTVSHHQQQLKADIKDEFSKEYAGIELNAGNQYSGLANQFEELGTLDFGDVLNWSKGKPSDQLSFDHQDDTFAARSNDRSKKRPKTSHTQFEETLSSIDEAEEDEQADTDFEVKQQRANKRKKKSRYNELNPKRGKKKTTI